MVEYRVSDFKLPFFKYTSKRFDSSIIDPAAGMPGFTKKIVNFLDHF
jgi:hypothetical protein